MVADRTHVRWGRWCLGRRRRWWRRRARRAPGRKRRRSGGLPSPTTVRPAALGVDDGPGLAVGDVGVGVVAAGGDPIAWPDPLPRPAYHHGVCSPPGFAGQDPRTRWARSLIRPTCSRVSATTSSPRLARTARTCWRSTSLA